MLEAARELRGQSGAEPEALRREADRGLDEVLPRQLAEPLVREVFSRDSRYPLPSMTLA